MKNTNRCMAELLDRRLLLAAGWPPYPIEATYSLADGELTVVGTDYRDQIRVATDLATQQIIVTLWPFSHSAIPLDQVQLVRIWAYDGEDIVDLSDLELPVTVFAGAGDDTVIGTMGADVIHGGAGRDLIRAVGGNDTVYGGAGDDRIYLGSGDDVCYGRDGIDHIDGQLGSDEIWGGEGNDLINGQWGGNHDEDLGADKLWGGPGNDKLWLGKGASIAYGEDGDDLLAVEFGGNPVAVTTLIGGDGNDRFFASKAGITHVHGGAGRDYGYAGEGDLLRDIETVEIPPGSRLNGYPLTSGIQFSDDLLYVYGSRNDDQISIASEDQRLLIVFNGVQIDNSIEGLRAAWIWGGTGNDTLGFSGFALPVVVFGGDGDDEILGTPADDELHGGSGIDTISGLAGEESLYGGEDGDSLYGGTGNDLLIGRAGADLLDGGEGEDGYALDGDDILVDVEVALSELHLRA